MNKQEILAILAEALSEKTEKAVTSSPSSIFGHGVGGLFSTPGLDNALFSALVLPTRSLESRLPAFPSNYENPIYGIMTGVTASTGSEAVNKCDTPPTAGVMKLMEKSAPFGLFSRSTRAFDLKDFGSVTNSGENMNLQLIGNAFNAKLDPAGGSSFVANSVRNDIAKAMFELGVAWSRDFARMVYTGNPANNTAGGGYKEFWGLDSLINTGYRDAVTGNLAPAADSLVQSFASVDVSSDPDGIVKLLTYMYRNIEFNAQHMGLDPLNVAFVMSWGLFYALTEIYPIAYDTYRSNNIIPTGATLFVDSAEERRMRDMLLTGEYLMIDGKKVPVIIDTAITETDLGGAYTSSIYIVPLTVMNNIPVTYWEYFNWNTPGGAMEAARTLGIDGAFDVRDNGRFLVVRDSHTLTCVQTSMYAKPRLVLRTPYLAGRITNVKYQPLIKERDWSTSNPSNYVNGGRTTSPGINPSWNFVP